jgi:hypothetical protein
MRSDTGLYLLATVVLLLGVGGRLREEKNYQAAFEWTNAVASRLAATVIAAPVLAVTGDNVNRRARLVAVMSPERTACVNAKVAREQARMARIQAQINRKLAAKSFCLEGLVRNTSWQ